MASVFSSSSSETFIFNPSFWSNLNNTFYSVTFQQQSSTNEFTWNGFEAMSFRHCTHCTQDNGPKNTFKTIAELKEEEIDTGHGNEELIENIKFVKLYRFDKDISGKSCWKNRASQSSIFFYKSIEKSKVRMVIRENKTCKLRMNHFVPRMEKSHFCIKQKQNNVYQWSAYDSSINNFNSWCIRFDSAEKGNLFAVTFENASKLHELYYNFEKSLNFKIDAFDAFDIIWDNPNDIETFQHRTVRAWEWDKIKEKWRGRGKGEMNIYYNKQKGIGKIGKIVFFDKKHEKTRLLQYIDGQQHCKYIRDDNNITYIEWEGSDYSMNVINPMIARWKVEFIGDEIAGAQFMQTFNYCIDLNIHLN